MIVKHIGRHGDRKVAVVFRTVPNEDHMCLVIYPETLPMTFHDSIMKVIESDVGQQANELADALFRNLLPDGRPMLETLHREGMIKRVPTNQVIMTPNASSHIKLDELNKILNEMAAGEQAVKKLAEIDAGAGLTAGKNSRNSAAEMQVDVLDDVALGTQRLDQANRMESEAKSLLAESERLRKEAFQLNPSLKPKKATAAKTVKPRVSRVRENAAQ